MEVPENCLDVSDSLSFISCSGESYLWKYTISNDQPEISHGPGGIVVRAHASHVEGLRFESDSMPCLDARSLFIQQQMGTWWQHWGDKGGEERNWPPYLTYRWLRISVLSNRHSPTYESIREHFYLYYIQFS